MGLAHKKAIKVKCLGRKTVSKRAMNILEVEKINKLQEFTCLIKSLLIKFLFFLSILLTSDEQKNGAR